MVPEHNHAGTLEFQLGTARNELERRIRDGRLDGAEALSDEFPELWSNPEAALELIYTEYVARIENGQLPKREDWFRRFPENRERLERLFGLYDLMTARDTRAGLLDTVHPDDDDDDLEDSEDQPAGYSLLEEIGRGGSAVVYRARQHSLNRLVAIKILRETPWLKDNDGRQLRSEAELAARLQHPNIVQVFEVGIWDAAPFLAMELVPGTGLHTLLADSQRHGSVGLTSDNAAELVETLARAMSYAHQQGVVHRDLKPANVLIAPSGGNEWPPAMVKIADFGLAVACNSSQAVIQTISVAGTPCYMAPEQAEARTYDVGPRSDIYALGAILYELLTARPPFQGATIVETLDMVRSNEPVPPRVIRPHVPRDLETICLKCLSKSPSKRYSSSLELAVDLRRFLDGKPIVARPVSSLERGIKWVKRHPAVAGLSAALLFAVAVGGIVQAGRIRESEAARLRELRLHREVEAGLAEKLVVSARALWISGDIAEAREALHQCPESVRNDGWKQLHALCHAEIASLSGPDYLVSPFAVSPDGESLAVYRRGTLKDVHLIDAKTGESRGTIPTGWHPAQIGFSGDGRFLLLVRQPFEYPEPGSRARVTKTANEAATWDLMTRQCVHRWPFDEKYSATLNHAGSRVAAWTDDGIQVRDAVSGDVVAKIAEPFDKNVCFAICLDNQGKLLAVRKRDKIRIWDIGAGQVTREIPFASDFSQEIDFRPDGRAIMIAPSQTIDASKSYPFVFWNVEDGREDFRIPAPHWTTKFAFSADGRRIAFGFNRNIEIYDAMTGTPLATLRGHKSGVAYVRFSPDGRRLYSSSADNSLRTWDISPWCD